MVLSARATDVIHLLLHSFWPILKAGLEFTIPLTIITFILGLFLGLMTAIIRLYKVKVLKEIAYFYVWVIRGTPLLVQLFILFYGLPSIGVILNPFTAAVIGFTLNMGAYNSEIIRAAIESIPKGQWEAAYSIGMTRSQAMKRIVIPQATKVSIPPLSNSFISLVKDTSLAATITVSELFRKGQEIAASQYEPFWLYVEVAVIYLIFCTVLNYFQSRTERRVSRHLEQ
jgi:L-cystine transport system permease protein